MINTVRVWNRLPLVRAKAWVRQTEAPKPKAEKAERRMGMLESWQKLLEANADLLIRNLDR